MTDPERGSAKSLAATQTVLGGSAESVARSRADHIITSMELESGVSSAENDDNRDLLVAEFYLSTLKGQLPWRGAVPDMSKLAASTQMDMQGFWWGWDVPAELARTYPPEAFANWRARTKCDICIYEAGVFYLEVYYCLPHWDLFPWADEK